MNTTTIIKHALRNAVFTALYVVLVGTFIINGEAIFGSGPDSPLMPIAMLMLLVFSASLCGSLIFGQSVFWFIDGKKKEAFILLAYTLSIFFIATVLTLVALIFSRA